MIDHKSRIWDTVSFRTSEDVLLTGVGVYGPFTGENNEAIICVDARPIEDPLRPLDVATELDSIYDDKDTLTIFSRVNVYFR
jgi:hypothetical protein